MPTVPEKQVDRMKDQKFGQQIQMVRSIHEVNIRKRCKAAYCEAESPPCLGGVKRLVNSPSKDGSLLLEVDKVNL